MTDRLRTFRTTGFQPPKLRIRTAVAAASLALAMTAGLASPVSAASVHSVRIDGPATITLELSSDMLAYDLLWSNHTEEARQAFVDKILAELDDPATPYLLQIPQLTPGWRPLPASFSAGVVASPSSSSRRRASVSAPTRTLRDMRGDAIDLDRINLGRIHYERDLEAALLDIIDRVRSIRPGAMLSIENFLPPQNFGAAAGSYMDITEQLDFMVTIAPVAQSSTSSRTKLNQRSRPVALSNSGNDVSRAFTMAAAPDNLFVLARFGNDWYAIDDDTLPELIQNPDAAGDQAPQWLNPDDDSSGPGVTLPEPPAPPIAPEPTPPPADEPDSASPVDQTPGSDDLPGDDVQPDLPSDPSEPTLPDADLPPQDLPDLPPQDDAPPAAPPSPPADDDSPTAPPAPPADDDQPTPPPAPPSPSGPSGDGDPSEPNPGSDPDDPPADNPAPGIILVPGSGFSGPTPQPAPIGSGPGADATAIVRWDVVPFQTFSSTFNIGVVAFHINGINRVEFSANGGPWLPVYDMTLNERTGVWEYWATLDAADFPDGLLEVRAIAYPNAGRPRVLAGPIDRSIPDAGIRGEHSMFLNANANGTLVEPVRWVAVGGSDTSGDGSAASPFASIKQAAEDIQNDNGDANGAIIYLSPGDYAYDQTSFASVPETSTRWLTVAGVPGQSPEAARITSTSGAGLRTKLVKFKNLTIHAVVIPAGGNANFNSAWTDHTILEASSPLDGATAIRGANFSGGAYSTDTEYRNSLRAVRELQLVRNANIHDIGGDAFRELRGLAANITIRNLMNLDGTHNDVMQFFLSENSEPIENTVIYGLQAVENVAGQSLFLRTAHMVRDFAAVNYLVGATGGGGAQWNDPADHVLLWNYQQVNNGFIVRDDSMITSITNFSVRDSIFLLFRMSHTGDVPNMIDQSWASNNHYIDMTTFQALAPGGGATTGGDPAELFMNPQQYDYRPRPGSVLTNRVSSALVPVDVDSAPRPAMASVGAIEAPIEQ